MQSKGRFPLLEQMRAERQAHEDAITEPYRQQIDGLSRLVRDLNKTLAQLGRTLGTAIGDHLTAQIADGLHRKIYEAIYDAVQKQRPQEGWDEITIKLPAHVMRFVDGNSMESEILRRWKRDALPALRLGIDPMKSTADVRILDIRIPPFGYRTSLLEH